MTYSRVFILSAFLAAASAAPWPTSVPICAEECPVTDISKLKYMTDKTYVYSYSGKSKIELKGVDGGVTEVNWKKKVLLSWLSPCEMAITFQGVTVDGSAPPEGGDFLERYPLVVAVTDGRVQQVCSHPNDDPWAINMKKGVASAFQNALPSLPFIRSGGMNITETDVVGRCPTRYEVEAQGNKFVVKKDKNHRWCEDRYPTEAETPAAWLKSPVPVERSWSSCKQEISNGIYSSITCEDQNVIRPSIGAYKYVEGFQESTLQYISENNEAPASLSTIHGEYRFSSLLYDHTPLNKDQSLVPLLEEKLTEVCRKTVESIEHDAASIMAEVIHLLKRVPDKVVRQTLDKIRQGQYCQQHKRLESLVLDAIAFTYDSGSVKTMVDELLSGKVTEGRTALYAAAFYLTHHPNIQAIEALAELFSSDKYLPSALLSAGTMVNNYCRHNSDCLKMPQVQTLVDRLNSRLQRHCTPCDNDDTKNAAFATLESLGNMGLMTPEVIKSTLKCIETKGVDTNIHVAAIRSFRNAECQRYTTMNLVNIAVDAKRDTEVRIASYLATIRCMEKTDLEEIIFKISKENNTQVRSFVLSHLLNVQKSTAPEKKNLRYLLSDFVIPNDYDKDIRKYSQNIDMSYYSPSMGLGAGVESNVIYAPGSFIPRSMALNFSSILYGQAINLGAIGARFEGLDEILINTFGPSGSLHKQSVDSILQKISDFVKEKGSSILEHFQSKTRQRRSLDMASVAELLKKYYNEGTSQVPRAELYANIMGQNIAYKFLKGNLHDIDFGNIFHAYSSKFKDALMYLRQIDDDYARTSQIHMDYHLATIQGTPLRIRFDGTAVLAMKVEGNIDLMQIISDPSNTESSLKIIPSLSVEANGFIGYDCFLARTGLQMNNTISSNSGMSLSVKLIRGKQAEVHIDLPENMELIHFESETYLMKMLKGNPEQKIIPPSIQDIRVKRQACINALEPMFGFRLCYDVDVPDVFHSTGLPLGARSIVKLHIEKTDASLRGYKLKAELENNQVSKALKVNLETKGSSTPKKTEAILSYTKGQDTYMMKATATGNDFNGGVWITFKNHEYDKSLEAYAEYKSTDGTLSQGFKIEYKTTSHGSASITDVGVFASQSKAFPPTSKILSMNVITRQLYKSANLAIILKTENAMRHILALTLEAGLDLETPYHMRIPVLKRLRRLELHLASAGWQITSYMRHESETEDTSVHTSSFKVSHGDNEVLGYEATHTIQRTELQEFSIKNQVKVKYGSSEYKIDQRLLYGITKTGVVLKCSPLTGEAYHLDFEASLTNSNAGHKVLFLVDMPEKIAPIKCEVNLVAHQELGQYDMEAFLEHGNRKALEITGPLSVIMAPDHEKIETNVVIKILGRQPYNSRVTYEYTKEKIIVLLDFANQRESLFLAEWKVGARSVDETHLAFRLDIHTLIQHRLDVIAKTNQIEMVFDNVVLPRTSHQQRVKGSLDVFYADKRTKMQLSWDADRDENKKFTLESRIALNPSNPGHVSIASTLNYASRIYNIRLEISADYFIHSIYGQNGFKFALTNSESKSLVFEVNVKALREGSHSKIDFLLSYKNMDDMEYKFTNLMDLDRLGGPDNFAVNSEMRYKVPQVGESSVRLMVKRKTDSSPKSDVIVQVTAAVAGFQPVALEFTSTTKPSLWIGELSLESHHPAKLLAYNVATYQRGLGLKTFDVSLDMTGVANLLKIVRQMIVREGATYPAISTYDESEGRDHCRCRYEQPTPSSHKLLIQTPGRRMEGECEFSPSVLSMKFYPDKEKSNAKYEVTLLGNRIGSTLDARDQYQWHGRISHPNFTRDKLVTLQYAITERAKAGTLELDIFPDAADKVTATLSSTFISQDTMHVVASFSTRILQIHPKLTVTTALAPNTVAFDATFQKTPSSAVSFMMAGKYDHISNRTSAVTFTLKSEGHSVVDVSALLEPEVQPECYGMNIKASLLTSAIGGYDIHSKMCKPAYIEIATNKHGSLLLYKSKFGFQNPNKVEVSVIAEDKAAYVVDRAFVARAQLTSPTLLNIDFHFEPRELSAMRRYLSDDTRIIVYSVRSWIQRIKEFLQEAAKSQSIDFPSAELIKQWQIIHQEAGAILYDLEYNKIQHMCERFIHFLHTPTVTYFTDFFGNVWLKMADIHRDSRTTLTWKVLDVLEEFTDVFSPIAQALRELAHMMQTGEEPEFIQKLLQEFEASALYQAIQSEMNDLQNKYPDQYAAFQQVMIKISHTLMEDLEQLRQKLWPLPPVQQGINWITNDMKADRIATVLSDKIVSKILLEVTSLVVTKDTRYFGMQISLNEPLYSLPQVLQKAIPYPSRLLRKTVWSHDTYIAEPARTLIQVAYQPNLPHITDYLPPFNETAMVAGNTEILTFDGEVIRIPRTPCRIFLASHANTTLSREQPQNQRHPKITLAYHSIKAVVSSDFRAYLNGRLVIDHAELLSVAITNSPKEIYITSPFLSVLIPKDSGVMLVEASGWAFGKTAGVLGTFDGERENDWLMPTGAMATDAQEFVTSWQEDHNCHTPSVTPAHVTNARVVECHMLIGLRSRCNPVVDSKPFIRMCREANDPCDAAKAYRTLCYKRGVHEAYPLPC